MATQSQIRQEVVSILYAYELGSSDSIDSAYDTLREKKIRNERKLEFALKLVNTTHSFLDYIDSIIKSNLQNWDISRIGSIEKSILRVAIAEIRFCKTDKAIVINEAVEMAKNLINTTSGKFINALLDKVNKPKKRLSKEEALKLLESENLNSIGAQADALKDKYHPNKIISFIVDRNINYTNICWIDCKFCAFYRKEKDSDAYILDYKKIGDKIDELLAQGGTQLLFQGGVHPKLKIEWYEDLVDFIHKKYPNIHIHGFSAVEIDYIAKVSKISIKEVLLRLKAKGLYSMPGAGAEILGNSVRDKIAPKKVSEEEWINVHKIAHSVGIRTSATMMYGMVENDADIIHHLDLIRRLQDETGGVRAFILWSFQSNHTKLIKEYPDIKKSSPNRYLKLLAIARIYLDNISNLQSSWVTQGSHIGQLALKYGANDLGSTMLEENVVKSAGASFRMDRDDMIHLIKDMNFIPAQRDTDYEIIKYF